MELLQESNVQRTNGNILTTSGNPNNNYIYNIRNDSSGESSINNSNIINRFNNQNEEIINNESSYRVDGPIFILKFYPNKIISILTMILNFIPGGLGTMLLGINRKSIKYIIGGIIQFILIDSSFILGFLLFKKEYLFKKLYNDSLHIYLFITSGFFYLISIYLGIINNFLFINIKRVSKFYRKEFGIFIVLLNLIIPGLGTLMIQAILPNKCVMKMRRTITGIGQLTMFIILFLFFTGLEKMNENLLLFIFLAIVEYLYTIGMSICFLRNIMITENISNEIEI